ARKDADRRRPRGPGRPRAGHPQHREERERMGPGGDRRRASPRRALAHHADQAARLKSGYGRPMTDPMLERLRAILRSYDGLLVAFSGGVDSTFLLRVAVDELGERCHALTC